MKHASLPSPIGDLCIAANSKGICYADFGPPSKLQLALFKLKPAIVSEFVPQSALQSRREDPEVSFLISVTEKLETYFRSDDSASKNDVFDKLVLDLSVWGTPFYRKVWAEVRKVECGKAISYEELSVRVAGTTKACRAVGAANGKNPISIIIPCHRIVGKDGSLTGYGGGIERKRWLLEWERSGKTVALRDCSSDCVMRGKKRSLSGAGDGVENKRRKRV
ncbi:methylated-DNA--cysteine S-met [Gonapodya prolifera JEL478]|uniref:Methylated-DNA--protein-cysteine methyltransferase n=1 Tax=Gonapodya prolifera (strain JEL478) TaxID=1344416 RepID=A0A138ZZ78_GONPJ|nr:methylated-DNA--cysteine S-met [Gonapodya prolifera JEL478]|eukprot:KXS09791.1 methylated-DNA--cysteine S-met [Gonapodya prolifera JEL478]